MAEDWHSIASRSQYTNSQPSEFLSGTSEVSVDTASVYHPEVAEQEDRAIARAKLSVAFVLVLGVAGLAVGVYTLVNDQEQEGFQNNFAGYGSEVIQVAEQKAAQLFRALDAFSVGVASAAKAKNESWPFVTIDDWSLKAKKLIDQADVSDTAMAFLPIVQSDQRENWTAYTSKLAPKYYQNSIKNEGRNVTVDYYMENTVPYIHFYNVHDNFAVTPITWPSFSLPVWQVYPLRTGAIVPEIDLLVTNFDIAIEPTAGNLAATSIAARSPTSDFTPLVEDVTTGKTRALSAILQPVYEEIDTDANDRRVVGFVWFRLDWALYLQNILTENTNGIIAVIRGSCPIIDVFDYSFGQSSEGQNFAGLVLSYRIDGPKATFLGAVDAHDPEYNGMEESGVFVDLDIDPANVPEGGCIPRMTLHLYPSGDLEKEYKTPNAFIFAGFVAAVFVFTSLVFLVYDYYVKKRQKKVMDRIIQQDRIVADVFPSAIRDRLYGHPKDEKQYKKGSAFDLLGYEQESASVAADAPLADLFPNTTVVFADIAGFTAWSSAREPHQVFILLESIYGAFDKMAYRHGVFKVETVGDCYVSVAGLPDPIDEHAVVACKFARDCLRKMKQITVKLEVSLGPDTAELDLRTGIHSGQVTAGVLRGERSRFQLFGDTMNTAARMESSGERNRIQLSQATANLLREDGFSKWIVARKGKTFVKGKGEMQTYWMRTGARVELGESDGVKKVYETAETVEEKSEDFDLEIENFQGMSKNERLVEWHIEVLSTLLEQIIASRGGNTKTIDNLAPSETSLGRDGNVLDEFIPIIPLKRLNEEELKLRQNPSSMGIGENVKLQLRNYLLGIAGMYRGNPFHNFAHASHVTASVKKLLSRIVNTGDGNGLGRTNRRPSVNMIDLAGHSYGITSDPLTQFAVVFSAIIHDVDHPGVPNTQLVKENTRNAQIYKKSVAEQNSVDLAWDLLMQKEYATLRACIYHSEEELKRFRQLVVNTVLATDIVDKELQALRKNRWETAFSGAVENDNSTLNDDRKATIVIEHLIQASDVSHTMQHWHIYKSWNEKFFMECYGAFKAGRAEADPSIKWYEGEIGFFDFYVIPLAKKLDNCGVFGVSSDEYLNYAQGNRDEWKREGKQLVEEFRTKYEENARNGKGDNEHWISSIAS
ncbi:unnamed protein product [Cylindrotheca closterium]|uniref:Phosphodiesterase n=1 Tax=Cylindrotheca closterium TaxID=2856 RepID=A0AAD2G2F0_9STRA|nr:unnamed protein product [Cylindrotheca closterium]